MCFNFLESLWVTLGHLANFETPWSHKETFKVLIRSLKKTKRAMIWTNMMTGWEKAFCSFYLLSISYAAVQRRCRRWSYLNSWFSCRGTQKQIEWLGMKREYFVGILQSTSEFVLSQRIWISFLRNLILNFYVKCIHPCFRIQFSWYLCQSFKIFSNFWQCTMQHIPGTPLF